MAVLLLRLAGPLQAWGDESRFTRRQTRPEPTKSGVLGLLAAAQGRRRTDPIEDLAALRLGVRVDQPGSIIRDFQTAVRWRTHREPERLPVSVRYYLEDAVFVAGVSGDEQLLRGLDDALAAPVFPLYLGRRSCPVQGRLRLGVHDGTLEEVLADIGGAAPWQASTWYRRRQARRVWLPMTLDAADGQVGDLVRDAPLSFDPQRREYGWREVSRGAPVEVTNPDGHDQDMDFMAVLGGA